MSERGCPQGQASLRSTQRSDATTGSFPNGTFTGAVSPTMLHHVASVGRPDHRFGVMLPATEAVVA